MAFNKKYSTQENYYQNHKEKILEKAKQDYKNNKKTKERIKKYRQRPDVKEKSRNYVRSKEVKEYQKQYRKRPGVKERNKKFSQSLYSRKKQKQYRQRLDIKERNKIYLRQYRENPIHKEAKKQYNKRPEVRERVNKIYKHKRNTNPKFAVRIRLSSRTRNIVKKYINKGLLPNKVDKQINWKEVCEHLYKTKPDNWQEYHIDHIKPLCSFDLTNSEELKQASHYTNLQWLTPQENLSKGGRF